MDRVPQRVDGDARVVSRAAAHADTDLVVRAPYTRDSARFAVVPVGDGEEVRVSPPLMPALNVFGVTPVSAEK